MSFYDEKQPKAPLLCAECEHLLKFRGEDWVINCSGMRSGHFKLRDLLLTTFPDKFTEIGFVYYASMLPNLRHEELTHFGAGLFWRGSVFDWKRFDPRLNQLEIPEAAREQLREYLLGHSEFPDCCGLLVQVSSRSHLWMFYPMTARNVGVGEEAKMTTFKIYVFGLTFTLFVANNGEECPCKSTSIAEHPYPIYLTDSASVFYEARVREMSLTARKVGAFGQALKTLQEQQKSDYCRTRHL